MEYFVVFLPKTHKILLTKKKERFFDLSFEWLPELGSNQRPAD